MPPLNLTPRGFIAGVADRIARSAHAARLATARRISPAHTKTAAAPWFAADYLAGPTWMPRDTTAFAREGFMQNAIVYRCVRMIAEAAGSVPLCLYDGAAELEDHPLLDLLARPAPASTYSVLIEAMIGHLLVSGNSYLEAIAVGGDVRELHVLRPDRIAIVPGSDGWPEAYDYTIDGVRPVRIEGEIIPGVRRVLHQRFFHPLNDHYGFSPIEAASVAIDVHNASSRWNKALLDNSARPSGALVYQSRDGNLTSEQYDRLKRELEAGFQGAANAGRPLLLEGGLDWKSMSMSPKDLDFMEAKHSAAREIALAFGVPPMMLGIPGDNTFSNYQEANRTFWRLTVLPLLKRVVESIGEWLTPAFSGALRLELNVDAVDALSPERDAIWQRLQATSFLTDNEKRASVGYGPKPVEQKFNPGQLRIPAGKPGGGQWTKPGGDGGGGNAGPSSGEGNGDSVSGGTEVDFSDGDIGGFDGGGQIDPDPHPTIADDNEKPKQIADKKGYNVDVVEEDKRIDGHIYERHVGKSEAYLKNRVETEIYRVGPVTAGLERAGSFPSLEAANKLTNSTLSQNTEIVEEVAAGVRRSARVYGEFSGSPTGYEAYKPGPNAQATMRDTFFVETIIRHNRRSPHGFDVITSFPRNRY